MGGIKFKRVNNITPLRSFLDLSNLIYKQVAPTELKPTTSDFQRASHILSPLRSIFRYWPLNDMAKPH